MKRGLCVKSYCAYSFLYAPILFYIHCNVFVNYKIM